MTHTRHGKCGNCYKREGAVEHACGVPQAIIVVTQSFTQLSLFFGPLLTQFIACDNRESALCNSNEVNVGISLKVSSLPARRQNHE